MGFPVTVILGASGRIGALLRQFWCPEQSPRTTATAQLHWQSRQPLRDAHSRPLANPVLDPLAEPTRLAALVARADVVLCLAGSIPGRGGDLADNSRLAEATIRASAQARRPGTDQPPRVLLASSAAVYGNQPGLLAEDQPLHPVQPYGIAKAEMEQRATRLGQQLGVPVTALRISNIAGLDAILGGWTPGFCLDQFGDGSSPRRSYVGPQALARILAALLPRTDLPPCLNLAQPGLIEMGALLRAADLPFQLRPAAASAIAEVGLDVGRLARLLAGTPVQQSLLQTPAQVDQLVADWATIAPHPTKETPGS
ncbi:NAD-dependent epimerase/dehydratase family protein [Pseudophaeobacter flagellatus]|uniref:NAD-dependent epimerase/dehydratase family protein n=1 Tax=Pseudophaeobacter flagellatus TaxID=2899119 RepID=UPI001E2ECBCE|nr:NAD(P)-dependent oxidoreductase [Pseudophaeobacter flagellatus]MCD9149777.1 NAD(P)-dependent oxidoreductase [Pseudophaeobacter flagellatus]